MVLLAGIDIGGTKCAVSLGVVQGDAIKLAGKRRFLTPATPEQAIHEIVRQLDELIGEIRAGMPSAVGISCGGPLDSRTGRILSPPNLPNWDDVNIVSPFKARYRVPVGLQNDANACALAEWKWGAGRGCDHMVFLTFGTGMGAGLILDGKLYSGASDMAGEAGHIRLAADGPVGYGKAGSFEGFCSGGGIAQLARDHAQRAIKNGLAPAYCPTPHDLSQVTAEKVGNAAQAGDPTALAVFGEVSRRLGQGIALIVDLLNPQKIVIGSIYVRQERLLRPAMLEALREEALLRSASVCEIVPAALAEQVGDYASLSVAMHAWRSE